MDQTNLLQNLVEFNKKSKPRKKKTFQSVNALYEGQELTLNAFKSGIFPKKVTKGLKKCFKDYQWFLHK